MVVNSTSIAIRVPVALALATAGCRAADWLVNHLDTMAEVKVGSPALASPRSATPPPDIKVEQVAQAVGPAPADVKDVKHDALSIFSPSSPRPARSPDDDKAGMYELSNENAIASSSRTPFSDDDDRGSSSPAAMSRRSRKAKGKELDGPTQLIDHLPRVEDEALATFDVLPENTFEKKHLGRSNQQEDMMICDCVFNPSEPKSAIFTFLLALIMATA